MAGATVLVARGVFFPALRRASLGPILAREKTLRYAVHGPKLGDPGWWNLDKCLVQDLISWHPL